MRVIAPSNTTNNIFIKAYANARKRCNNGRINADLMELADLKYTEPSCFDYLIELYKLENRLRYHGIEIPKNQKVSGLSDLRLSIEGFRTKIHYIADVMTKAVKYILSKYVGNTQTNVTYDVKILNMEEVKLEGC